MNRPRVHHAVANNSPQQLGKQKIDVCLAPHFVRQGEENEKTKKGKE